MPERAVLAHVVTGDANHLPLYRQSEIYRRQGVELSCATLALGLVPVAETAGAAV